MRKEMSKLGSAAGAVILGFLLVTMGCAFESALETEENQHLYAATGFGADDAVLKLMLTDYPLKDKEVKKVNIKIKSVEIHSDEHGWETLVDYTESNPEGKECDLLELTDGAQALLGLKAVTPGLYSQVRLVLNSGNTIVVQKTSTKYPAIEQELPLTIPSGEQTGIKIHGDFEVIKGMVTTVVLDFDAQKSVHCTGKGDYKLKPSIKMVAKHVTQDTLLYFEDFGEGFTQSDIPGWEEMEDPKSSDKCIVVYGNGGSIEGRFARIYGQDVGVINHYFYRDFDLSGWSGGKMSFWARGSDSWDSQDHAYVDVLYDGKWYPVHSFSILDINADWTQYEFQLTEEMMRSDFYVRFRNGMNEYKDYWDMDNFEISVH
jgi:hypothetical protein